MSLFVELAKEIPEEKEKYPTPWLLSVANLREEKNYPRMVETMRYLRDKGQNIRWLCVGSTANPFQLNKVQSLLEKYQLKDDFILLGTKKILTCIWHAAQRLWFCLILKHGLWLLRRQNYWESQ